MQTLDELTGDMIDPDEGIEALAHQELKKLKDKRMSKELPCPHCGQDIHIPARYNAENIARLESENQELRELFVYFFGENYQELEDE